MPGRDAWAEHLAGAFTGLMILALVVSIWLMVKAVELIVRVLIAHPTNRPLWVALSVFLINLILVLLTGGAVSWLNSLLMPTAFAVVVMAKAVETYYEQRFLPEVSRASLAAEVVYEPWWNVA